MNLTINIVTKCFLMYSWLVFFFWRTSRLRGLSGSTYIKKTGCNVVDQKVNNSAFLFFSSRQLFFLKENLRFCRRRWWRWWCCSPGAFIATCTSWRFSYRVQHQFSFEHFLSVRLGGSSDWLDGQDGEYLLS